MAQSTRVVRTQSFLRWYESSYAAHEAAARQLQEFLVTALDTASISAHLVYARVKTLDSVRGKLLHKRYSNPRKQLTDTLGARIILHHGHEVDRVATLLRGTLTIREGDSSDKRLSLGLREFGYRSYHLVGQLPPALARRRELSALSDMVFEVQIRSILEHVWAEIEHSVVYKSGADLPSDLKRRFASLAAILEVLEREFAATAVATDGLVDEAKTRLSRAGEHRLDVPALLAAMEMARPDGAPLRPSAPSHPGVAPAMQQRLRLALAEVGITTVRELNAALSDRGFARQVRRYALLSGVGEGEASHLAILALLLQSKAPDLFEVCLLYTSPSPRD